MFVGEQAPDLRDGLTPVQRGILHGMAARGLGASAAFQQSATTLAGGRDARPPKGAYAALVDMAQAFQTAMPLVDGQGNFGSAEGDPPAAARYTECRLSAVGAELTGDVGSGERLGTDEALTGGFPNLLVNGCRGRAASFPPHNLHEVVDALLAMLEHPKLTLEPLLGVMPGPDFPTGAIVHDRRRLERVYATGRGSLLVYARVHLEPGHPRVGVPVAAACRPADRLVVTELPFGATPKHRRSSWSGTLRPPEVHGIADVVNESDRHNVRLRIVLREGSAPAAVLQDLYQHTPLRVRMPVNLTAAVEGVNRTMSLPDLLRAWLAARRESVGRRDGISDPAAIEDRIRRELHELARRFGAPRRTTIAPQVRPAATPPTLDLT